MAKFKVFGWIFLIVLFPYFIVFSIDEGAQGFVWLFNSNSVAEYLGLSFITSILGFGIFHFLKKLDFWPRIFLASFLSVIIFILLILILGLVIMLGMQD